MSTYNDNVWDERDHDNYRKAKEIREGSSPIDLELTSRLVHTINQVWLRAHHPSIKNMRKSGELTRLIRLMDSVRLFPEPDPHRLELLWQIATKSTQRPVASEAALMLLVLKSREAETFDALRTQELFEAPEQTLPMLALVVELDPVRGPGLLKSKIGQMDLNERRLRLVELLDVLKQELELDAHKLLVHITFEALFDGLNVDGRKSLVDRLFREVADQRLSSSSRWSLVLSPLFEQNLNNVSFQARVLEIALEDEASAKVYWPLVLHYMRTCDVRLWTERLWSWLEVHGQLGAVAILYPVAQDKPGLFAPSWRRQASLKAERLVEVISKREGHKHAFGALSVIHEDAGQLTLAGHHGALTLDDDPVEPMTVAPYIPRDAPRVSWLMTLWIWLRSLFSRR